jgi:hypothetical protein
MCGSGTNTPKLEIFCSRTVSCRTAVQKQVVTRVAFAPGERIWVCVTRISSQIWDTGFATSFTGTQLRKTLSPLILSRHTRPKPLDTGRAVASDPSSTGGEVLAWGLELIAGA